MDVWVEMCGSTYIDKIDKICIKREAHMHSSVHGIQAVVTSSILGIRGSSFDGRELSIIPFNYTPLVT